MERPRILQAPIYLDGAPAPPPADLARGVRDVYVKSPGVFGLIGATLLGATAAYFVPKIFDATIPRLLGRERDTVELEVDDE